MRGSEALKPPTAEGGSLRSQNTENLDGSIIRVDPETGAGLGDNPMNTSPNANRRRIVAYGLRNPFRFTINPLTNEVYVGNVGWNTYEEIDRFSTVPSKAYNSGWPCYEGPGPTPAFQGLELNACKVLYAAPGSTSPPFFSYTHGAPVTPEDPCPDQYGSSITGIAFNEGSSLPASYKGALFFADSVRGCIYVMFPGQDGRPDPSTTIPFLTEGGYPGVDIEEGPEGSLYYTVLFEGAEYTPHSGSIHKIAYASGNQPPIAHLSADREWGTTPLEIHFDASGSTDANGEALTYEWDLTGSGSFGGPGKEATKVKTFNDSQNHVVAVRVKDGKGASSVARVTIYPGDMPPEPAVAEPSSSMQWTVGQAIHFKGTASDKQDGTVPSTSLDWNSRLFHCPSACHVHPLQAFPAVGEGTLIAPDHDLPSHIELTLTATDSRGLEASKSIALNPKAVGIAIESEPSGLTLTAGLLAQATPFQVLAIEGSKFTLSTPAAAKVGAINYVFAGWSDGGERVHTITASPANPSYKAVYSDQGSSEEGGGDGGGGAEAAPAGSSGPGPSPTPPPLFHEPPQTRLDRHPAERTKRAVARFGFLSSPGNSRFRCKIDQRPFQACSSPATYGHLQPGWHVFRVAAVDLDGIADPTPASFRWLVIETRR